MTRISLTTIGVLGGGQLGRMLGQAGIPMGLKFIFLDPNKNAPAKAVGNLISAEYTDEKALKILAKDTDLVTFEFENVPESALVTIANEGKAVSPSILSLTTAQDRLHEKSMFQQLAIPTPQFRPVETKDDLTKAISELGLPAVLKTRRQGYDGKGQAVIRTEDDIDTAFEKLKDVPLTLEQFIPFTRELSLLCVRSTTGEIAYYPLTENVHKEGILRTSTAPAPHVSDELQKKAQSHAGKLLGQLGHVGMLAIEFCEYEGDLMAIEMAPRVHNSGHWTIEGAFTSQFENHLRAILGLPLGATEALAQTVMINLIGTLPNPADVLAIPGAHLHLYGKEPRPGRKVGHITILHPSEASIRKILDLVNG